MDIRLTMLRPNTNILSECWVKIIKRTQQSALFFTLYCLLMPIGNTDTGIENLKIGVLAYQGTEKAVLRWQPTLDLLNNALKRFSFELIPLSLQEVNQHVKERSIDFIITNTGNYIYISHKYGASRIATLVNKKNGLTSSKFGAVVFSRADRTDINSLQDIAGKSVSAVNKTGFGGFYMAQLEFENENIDIFSTTRELTFTGFPQIQVLNSVLNGESDVGTFRTDSLEQIVNNQGFDLSTIKILNQKTTEGFPFIHSTDLYPEWPISKLQHTSKDTAHLVALTLLSMPAESRAAIAAQSAGWTIPLNYKPAYDLLKTLNAPPFDIKPEMSIKNVVEEYSISVVSIVTGIAVMIFSLFFIAKLNAKLRKSNHSLKSEVRKRIRLANKLEYLASHDELTGIYNRRAFTAQLQAELDRSIRYKTGFSLLLLDIDNFKITNDKYGHQTGDILLSKITDRIQSLLRSNDLFFRVGGDEFAIINIDVDSKREIEILCERICRALEDPYSINKHHINSSMSIGFSICSSHGQTIETLVSSADINMYQNKKTKSFYSTLDVEKVDIEKV